MSGKMSGPQKAATFMLAVGEEHASKLFAMMHEDEIRDILGHGEPGDRIRRRG